MAKRRLPLDPSLEQLRNQAKALLDSYVSGDPDVAQDFASFHPRGVTAEEAKLSDAQLVLARTYAFPSWPRLRLGVELSHALSAGDLDKIRRIVMEHPDVMAEQVRGEDSSWGPPLSFAANLGDLAVIDLLLDLGAEDVQFAFDRAVLQGKIDVARGLAEHGGKPEPGMVMLPCETLNADGLSFLVEELGADLSNSDGDSTEPLRMILETYSRNPDGKHRCLDLVESQGTALPDTPVMALHRGRVDLLEAHLERDSELLARRFPYNAIYPYSREEGSGLHGTPLEGTALLHMAVDFDEQEIFDWLLEKGADPNVRAEIDPDGFGGHTPLFNSVVSQAFLCGRQKDAGMARTLLERGADPNATASIRKALRFTEDEGPHEYREVTPVIYGEQFHLQRWVNQHAMEVIQELEVRDP